MNPGQININKTKTTKNSVIIVLKTCMALALKILKTGQAVSHPVKCTLPSQGHGFESLVISEAVLLVFLLLSPFPSSKFVFSIKGEKVSK